MGHPSLGSAPIVPIARAIRSPQQRDLWYRIEAHPFERGDHPLDFTRRLARDRGWSLAFARGAVAEYRRFCFLAMIFDTPVSPSEEVDEVWHQHLTYSRDYWDVWCASVLGGKLHHDPTVGGPAEQRRYRAQYAETLARYETHFGPPDPAYWPGTARRFRARPRYRIVDGDRVLLLPKPRWPARLGRAGGTLALLLAAPRPAQALPLDPLDWTAGPFLTLYVTLAACALLTALAVRGVLRRGEPARGADALDVVELAYLAGGAERAADTVILGFLAAGAARFGSDSGRITVEDRGAPLPRHLEPFRAAIGDGPRATAIRALRPRIEAVRERLVRAGLSPSRERLRRMALATLVPILPVVALGIAKIAVGLERGKPVGFLVLLTVVTAVVGLAILVVRPVRTGAGDALLDRYRARNGRAARAPRERGDEVLLALALGGTAALIGTSYEAYGRAAAPSSGTAGGCGSGGGDGGGGGGGGCGGCGGGD